MYQIIKKFFYFFKHEILRFKSNRYISNKLLKNFCKLADGNVLNIGSGNDNDKTGDFYKNYFKKCKSYTTLEYEEGQSDLVADIQNMPIVKDNSFDFIFCIWVLEHVENLDLALKEINRILRKSGKFLFTVPLNVSYHGYPQDYWRFSSEDIKEMLKKNNFEILELKKIGNDEKVILDERLNFYKNKVDTGPYGYVALAIK